MWLILLYIWSACFAQSTARQEAERLARLYRTDRPPLNLTRKLNIAHRGNEQEYRENSLAAFASAAELRADYVELDIVLTKDNQPLVFHDANFSRGIIDCGNLQNKAVRDFTAEEIQSQCRFTSTNFFTPTSPRTPSPENLILLSGTNLNIYSPPFLSDVLEIVSPSKTGLLIEIKTFSQQNITFENALSILDTLIAIDPEKRCTAETVSLDDMDNTYQCFSKIKLMSFDTNLMDYLDLHIKNNPKYQRLYRTELIKLVWASLEYIERLVDSSYASTYWNLDGVAFNYKLGQNTIDEAKLDELLHKMNENSFSKGKHKFLWTAHTTEDIRFLKHKPITGIIHSRPRDFYLRRGAIY